MRLRLSEWLKQRGVTQAQVAQALSVKEPSVSAWVKGKRRRAGVEVSAFPDFASFEALCRFFDCTPNDLIDLEATGTPTGLTWVNFRPDR